MRQANCFLLTVFLGAVLLAGCSKRQNPADPDAPPRGNVVSSAPRFKNTLDTANNALIVNNLRPEPEFRRVRVYVPPGYQPRGSGRPFPTLYLLHDFGVFPGNIPGSVSNDGYFNLYELAPLLDRLIAAGEIKSMIVVQADLPSYFYGGSFYTNSASTGRFFTAVDSFLVHFVDSTYNTVFGRRARAVSGHGMGGYGALKLVLTGNDTTFGSVSALSAPLAFGDPGSGMGFQSPFYVNGLFSENGVAVGDSARFRRDTVLFPDPRLTQKIRTNLLFAMGAAFSPVADTALFKRELEKPFGRDSLLDTIPIYFQFSKSPKDPGFLFPVNWNGTIIDSVWQKWLAHDIKTMLSDPSKVARLDSTPFYFSCGLQDELRMLEQNRDFLFRLLAVRPSKRAATFIGMDSSQFYYEEYSGYPGRPADHTTFIADQLVKVLKFHSQFLDTAAVP